jgi:hypothetical protein
MPLTRFLYMTDEVSITLMENIITQSNLAACYFWITEYYFSGFRKKTWQLLWKIFYDFYAIKYPKLEKYIMREHMKWRSLKHISSIMDITLQLFVRNACSDVFLARHISPKESEPTDDSPQWLSSFSEEDRSFLLALHAQDIAGILFYSKKMNDKDMYRQIGRYFKKVKKMDLCQGYLSIIPYNNKKHILLALILYLHSPEENIILDEVDVEVCPEDIAWVKDIHEKPITPLYRTLVEKRLYSISDTIGCFQLQRFDSRCPPIKRLLGFHWEYFASYAPLWKKRFREYKATRNAKGFEMIFENDDHLEEFGERYNYEPDEQSNETQDKSIREIKKRSPREWVKEVFDIDYVRKRCFPVYI